MFTDPAPIGNAYGPGRDAVICISCGAVVLTPIGTETDWLELHSTAHQSPQEPPC